MVHQTEQFEKTSVWVEIRLHNRNFHRRNVGGVFEIRFCGKVVNPLDCVAGHFNGLSKVLVFGTSDSSLLLKYYIEKDPLYHDFEVVGFTVTKDFLDQEEIDGLPVIDFADAEMSFPPSEYLLFAPLTGTKMNKFRAEIFHQGKAKGYSFFSYVSSWATILTEEIGENCFILEDNTVQPFVKIGNNVVLWSGNHIGHHSTIHDHVYFTSHVVLSGHCDVGAYSWFGVNATVRDQISIGESTLVAMGALISKDTDSSGFYLGVPAKKQAQSSHEVM